jgi:hypothetical protein
MTEPRRYRVYLLRLWLLNSDEGVPSWRASLEDARSGERYSFAGLPQLFTFLAQQASAAIGQVLPQSEEEP